MDQFVLVVPYSAFAPLEVAVSETALADTESADDELEPVVSSVVDDGLASSAARKRRRLHFEQVVAAYAEDGNEFVMRTPSSSPRSQSADVAQKTPEAPKMR
jgi:hypothetical protein